MLRRKQIGIVWLVAALGAVIWAQDSPQTNSETVIGDIGVFLTLEHSIDVEAGEVLTILARGISTNLNPALTLRDPDQNVIAQNDDHETESSSLDAYDAIIANLTAPEDGAYTIQVTNRFWSRGAVEIIIIRGETDPLAWLESNIAVIRPGSGGTSAAPEGQCTARVDLIPARLRYQPTTDSRVARTLQPGQRLRVDGWYQREGTAIWYRMEGYLWAREDVIILEGDCQHLQVL